MEYSLLRDDPFIFFWLLVWSILGIILFFKLWRMTDDVRAIRNMMAEQTGNDTHGSTPQRAENSPGQQRQPSIIWLVGCLMLFVIIIIYAAISA